MKAKKFDVTVIGAGITGLLLTLKLARLGISVQLVEANNEIAKGPSTRNEGWIHAGSYHAFGIDDEITAIKVAKNCIYGYEQISRDYSECIEEPFTESVVIIKKHENISKAIYRWTKSGVFFKQLDDEELKEILNDVNIPEKAVGFLVKERAINTRILYQRILEDINAIALINPNIVCIRTGVKRIRFLQDKKTAMLQMESEQLKAIKSEFFIYTAGAGTKEIFQSEHPKIECPIRVFQSHLLITKRMSRNNVFFVEEGEITAMGHGDMTIIGSTKDNDEIKAIKDFELAHNKRKTHLSTRTASLFKKQIEEYEVYSCNKVDVGVATGYQSLEPKIFENKELPNHIICCPGKMTEAPILVNRLTHQLFNRLDASIIAKRPCDIFKK